MSHLATLTPLIGIIARERTTTRPDLYDDARQEGLIRAWTVEEDKPDAPREYVLAAARRGIGDVVRGRRPFGAASRRGWQDAADTAHGFHLDASTAEDFAGALTDERADDAFRTVEARETLRRALRELSPGSARIVREYALEGRTFAAIARDLGAAPETVSRAYRAALVSLRDLLEVAA